MSLFPPLLPRRALVLFSGGQDSTTCLAHALSRYERVETIAFDYGQRHHVELEARLNVLTALRQQFPAWSERLGDDHLLDVNVLGQISETSLTRDVAFAMPEKVRSPISHGRAPPKTRAFP